MDESIDWSDFEDDKQNNESVDWSGFKDAEVAVEEDNKYLTEEVMKDTLTNDDTKEDGFIAKAAYFIKDKFTERLDRDELYLRGGARPVLGLMRMAETFASKAGIGDEKIDTLDWISDNEDAIKEKLDKLGYEDGSIINEANAGQLLMEILPASKLRHLGLIVGVEGATGASSAAGKGKGADEIVKEGAIAGATTGLVGITFNIANKLFGKTEIPTDFANKIETLDVDGQKVMNDVLDHLDAKSIEKMDSNSRNQLIDDILEGGVDSKALSKDIIDKLSKQESDAYDLVKAEYTSADKLARESDEVKISKEMDVKLRMLMKGAKKEKKARKDVIGITKVGSDNKYNAHQLEGMLQTLKEEARSPSKGSGTKLYAEAIDYIQKLQDDIGGSSIYRKARELSKQHKIDYKGSIEDAGSTAGSTVKNLLSKKNEYYVGEKLFEKGINPDKIGVAVRGLSQKDRSNMFKDIISKGIDDASDVDTGIKMLKNYNSMDKNGIAELIGKPAAKELKKNMQAITLIESSISNSGRVDTEVATELLNIATALSMAKLSPFLAAKSTAHNTKSIIKKFMNKKDRNNLIARVKKVDPSKRRGLMKATSIILAGLPTSSRMDDRKLPTKEKFIKY